MSKVDLASGRSGIITFMNGDRYFCMTIRPLLKDGHNLFEVRIESGWYDEYYRDGTRYYSGYDKGCRPQNFTNRREIINFIPCHIADERIVGLSSEVRIFS